MEGSGHARGPVGSAPVSVRPARPDDAREIARVQAVTWRTAYRALLPAELLDEWDDDAATAAWATAISTPPTARHGVLVALDRETVVGFAAFGPAEAADDVPVPAGTTEVAILLVEPRWGRRGHGSRLLAAVADLAPQADGGWLQTWLPESDRVSARFLESAGWVPAGWARSLDTGAAPMREILWHTRLPDPVEGATGTDEEGRS